MLLLGEAALERVGVLLDTRRNREVGIREDQMIHRVERDELEIDLEAGEDLADDPEPAARTDVVNGGVEHVLLPRKRRAIASGQIVVVEYQHAPATAR